MSSFSRNSSSSAAGTTTESSPGVSRPSNHGRSGSRRVNKLLNTKYLSHVVFLLLSLFASSSLLLGGVDGKIMDQHPHDEGITDHVQAVLGSVGELPCDLSVVVGDKIRLVLWSKNNSTIYSLDARDKHFEDAQHWADEQMLGGRAYFRTNLEPPSLVIENIRESDAGLYKCRLDFKRSQTVHRNINLTVIIPPQKVIVVDERGLDLNSLIIGPYNEGASLRLTCISTGGWPIPRVSWWREGSLLDDSWEISSEHITSTIVSNTLTIEQLRRSDLHAKLTCQASNSNISVPVSTTVALDMSFRPLEVRLLESKVPLSADMVYTIKCQSTGARPPAVMTWWRGDTRLKSHREVTSADGNLTTSMLNYTPTIEDSGKLLSCRAENPLIHGSSLQDGWKMNIHYVPQVSLDLGSTLNSSQIHEGADVYFECSVKANPWITKVSWRHNGRILTHNTSAGVIISNQSLVLQTITRKSAGLYTCVASNKEGDGASNVVYLNVKYAPVCKPGQQQVYGIARLESAKITCDVDANPETDLIFRWKFNNSAESIDIQQSHFAVEKTRSTLTYKPMTELDYGTVQCYAFSDIGTQKIPCVYHIIPAGKPDAVTNCTILNQTFDSLYVSCLEGFNGGLQQTFTIEILDFHSHAVLKNFTNARPLFHVRNLDPGSSFIVRIYAVNNKGRSDTQVLQASTLKAAEKQTGMSTDSALANLKPAFLQNATMFAILIGVVATLIVVAVVIVVILRSRGHTGEDKRIPKNNGFIKPDPAASAEHDNSSVPLKKSLDDLLDGADDKNPDVVPHSLEIDGIDPDEKIFLERLNNSSRFYETIPRAVRTVAVNRSDSSSPAAATSELVNNVKCRTPRCGREEVTYAELSLPNSPAYPHQVVLKQHQHHHHGPPQHQHHHHRPSQEPIIYAQIDPMKSAGSAAQQCPSSSTSNTSNNSNQCLVEQQTQTIGGYPNPMLHATNQHHQHPQHHLSPPSEVDCSMNSSCTTPLLLSYHSPAYKHRESTVEEYVRLRPENVHAVYNSNNGSNTLRF